MGLPKEKEVELHSVDDKEVKSKVSNYKNPDKMLSVYEMTLSNYSNMFKRLSRKENFSKFILIYYSVCLIIYPLTSKFFPNLFSNILGNYFGIILSIIVLVYSIINSNARYSLRIYNVEKSLNAVKSLKRQLAFNEVEEINEKYHDVCNNTETRDDVDFFITVKQMCRRNNLRWYALDLSKYIVTTFAGKEKIDEEQYEKVKGYLSELNKLLLTLRILFEYIWYLVIAIVPICIFLSCIFCDIS